MELLHLKYSGIIVPAVARERVMQARGQEHGCIGAVHRAAVQLDVPKHPAAKGDLAEDLLDLLGRNVENFGLFRLARCRKAAQPDDELGGGEMDNL